MHFALWKPGKKGRPNEKKKKERKEKAQSKATTAAMYDEGQDGTHGSQFGTPGGGNGSTAVAVAASSSGAEKGGCWKACRQSVSMWENQVVDSSPQGTDQQTEQPRGRTRLDDEPSEQPPPRQLLITDFGLESEAMRFVMLQRLLDFLQFNPLHNMVFVCRNCYAWVYDFRDIQWRLLGKKLLRSDLRCLRWRRLLRKLQRGCLRHAQLNGGDAVSWHSLGG